VAQYSMQTLAQFVWLINILEHFELVVNTVSMEEAVQQQLEADGEFEEPPEDDAPEQQGE
jgi:hypothetical protein